jgi:predicted nuclease of predicted toxin-antitoxin system
VRILANENLYDPIVEYLRTAGHSVFDTKRTELAGAPDEAVYERAVREQLVVVTMDKDFTRSLRFPPAKCGGIIVAKLYRMTVAQATAEFRRHFQSLSEDQIRGRLVIMTRDGVRIRPATRAD